MRRPKEFAFDLGVILQTDSWKDEVYWPIRHYEFIRTLQQQSLSYLEFIRSLDDVRLKNIALLCAPLLGRFRAYTLGGYAIQAAQKLGLKTVSSFPEFRYLSTGNWESDPTDVLSTSSLANLPRWGRFIRQLVRIRTWSSYSQIPYAIIKPYAVALSHNSLLRTVASQANKPIGYQYAESILRTARKKSKAKEDYQQVHSMVNNLAHSLNRTIEIEEQYRERVKNLIQYCLIKYSERAYQDLECLGNYKKIPTKIWSGTGGKYASRAVGLEVLRRGGDVIRYSHSGACGLIADNETEAINELAVSSCFVVPTMATVQNLESEKITSLVSGISNVSLEGARGDPMFKNIKISEIKRHRKKPKVIYASTIFCGQRQYSPPLLPDVVYLEWQKRLTTALKNMPIELTFKPHPGGLLQGKPHPLTNSVQTSSELFELIMGDADVFIFDYPATTTFWEAVCTNRTVILLDFGNVGFNNSITPLVQQRCTIIPVKYDERNIPFFDEEYLRLMILDGSKEPKDPSVFRSMLGGEA